MLKAVIQEWIKGVTDKKKALFKWQNASLVSTCAQPHPSSLSVSPPIPLPLFLVALSVLVEALHAWGGRGGGYMHGELGLG
jgi:hypothetical protein